MQYELLQQAKIHLGCRVYTRDETTEIKAWRGTLKKGRGTFTEGRGTRGGEL